jgi:hypothetical protein
VGTWHDPDLGRPIAAPPDRCAELLGETMRHKFWVARYGRYAIRIDATRRGVYPWLITLEGRSVRKGVAPTVTRPPMR